MFLNLHLFFRVYCNLFDKFKKNDSKAYYVYPPTLKHNALLSRKDKRPEQQYFTGRVSTSF